MFRHLGPVVLEAFLLLLLVVISSLLHFFLELEGVLRLSLLNADIIVLFIRIRVIACLLLFLALPEIPATQHQNHYDDEESQQAADYD